MNVLPVIQRELRVASRRRETWNLRLVFSGGTLLAFGFGMMLPRIGPEGRGQVVLICLAVCGFVLSLLAGPYLTADVVSSEKREGTLGLLFLTPLNGWQIVLGKMVTHSLQVGYALLGIFTLFFLPLFLGGVVWSEVARIVLTLLLTLLLSLACGIFWSTLVTEARTAVLATLITVLLFVFLPWLPSFLEALASRRAPLIAGLPQLSPMTQILFAFEENFRATRTPVLPNASGAFIYWGSVLCSLICSVGLVGVASWLLPGIWRRSETGARVPKPERPTMLNQLVALRPRIGDAEPLLWLALRGVRESLWIGAMRALVLCFFGLMLFLSVTTRNEEECFIAAICAAYGLHLVTRIQFALTATRRLTEDRRSGALEALLTTPIEETALIAAYHESLKVAFRLPLVMLIGMNAALLFTVFAAYRKLHMGGGAWMIFSAFFVGGALITLADFVALRWFCLREALRSATQMKAVGRAFGRLCVLAWPVFGLAWLVAIQFRDEELAAMVFLMWAVGCVIYDWIVAGTCRDWVHSSVRRRVSEG